MAFKKGEGGRQKGVPNKATADLKALAGQYTAEAVTHLAALMRDLKSPARLGAIQTLLDRSHGKPPQAVTGPEGGPIAVTVTVIHEHHG